MTVSNSEYHLSKIVLITSLNEIYNLCLIFLQLRQHALFDFKILHKRISWGEFLKLINCISNSRWTVSHLQILGNTKQMTQSYCIQLQRGTDQKYLLLNWQKHDVKHFIHWSLVKFHYRAVGQSRKQISKIKALSTLEQLQRKYLAAAKD